MEKSTEEKPENPANKKETAREKTFSGTEEKKSAWETGLETIAGDNKLLGTVLKVVLSPIGLAALACGAGYMFYKNSTYKRENQKLVEENKSLLEQYKDLKASHDQLHEKYVVSKNRRALDYEEDEISGLLSQTQHQRTQFEKERSNKKQGTFYLD